MNNPACMNIFKGLSKSAADRGNTTDVQCPSGKKFGQSRARDVLTNNEGLGGIDLNI